MKVIKKPIHVKFQPIAERAVIKTLEGDITAEAGQVLMTGVKGEQYPITREFFDTNYIVVDAAAGTCYKKPVVVEAEVLTGPDSVMVSWSPQPLHGVAGDYKLTYGPGDFGIVRRDIFEETYDIVEG